MMKMVMMMIVLMVFVHPAEGAEGDALGVVQHRALVPLAARPVTA